MAERITNERLKEIFEGVKVQIGLRQQGHMGAVMTMVRDAASWEEIGKAIGWDGPTARDWYIAESTEQLLAYRESGALEGLRDAPCKCLSRPLAGKAEREVVWCKRCAAIKSLEAIGE